MPGMSAVPTEIENQAYDQFEAWFIRRNPRPTAAARRLVENLGLDFWLSIAQGLSAFALSAMRTGSAFYVSALGTPGLGATEAVFVAVVEAGAAVLAYELTLIGIGITDGRRTQRLSRIWKIVSISLSVATTIAAGFWVSSSIDPNLPTSTKQSILSTMRFLMGLAPVLSIMAGERIGQSYAEAQLQMREYDQQYVQDENRWETDLRASWTANRMVFIRRISPDLFVKQINTQAVQAQIVSPEIARKTIAEDVVEHLRRNNIDPLVDVDYDQLAAAVSEKRGETVQLATIRKVIQRIRERNKERQ